MHKFQQQARETDERLAHDVLPKVENQLKMTKSVVKQQEKELDRHRKLGS